MFKPGTLQGPAMGEGPEGVDMLSTLQAMSAHGGHMNILPGVLNNPMQPPFSQQVHLSIQPRQPLTSDLITRACNHSMQSTPKHPTAHHLDSCFPKASH